MRKAVEVARLRTACPELDSGMRNISNNVTRRFVMETGDVTSRQVEEAEENSLWVRHRSAGEMTYEGLAVSRGIAIGPAYVYERDELSVVRRELAAEDVAKELERWRMAVSNAERELTKIASVAREKLGEMSARIFEAQALMLLDESLMEAVESRIRKERVNASYAVKSFFSQSRSRLEASGNDYFQERANDLLDIQDRIIRNLRRGKLVSTIDPDTIVVAEKLTAADIVLFSRRNILGYVTDYGGPTSHVSLMAKGMGLPAIVSLHGASESIETGDTLVLDGFNGRLIVNPTDRTLELYLRLQEQYQRLLTEEKKFAPLASETIDGMPIKLMANLEFKEEVELVHEYGAEGVGLFRTEFLFLMRGFHDYTEDEQYAVYSEIVASVAPGVTTFRLFDLGGDKMLPMAHREHNPFLGWRGIRILLDKPELLEPQLRAILRASAGGPARILVPMITNLSELNRLKKAIDKVKAALREEGTPFDEDTPVGIMVEVPSVALMAEHFATEVDFFSIGSNDLTQYTLAVDRGNDLVADRYEELEPAVLRLIKCTVDAAREAGIPVSLCGELASDPLATAVLIGLGVEEFSASPSFLPEIKRVVRSMRRTEAEALAAEVMTIFDAGARKKTLLRWLKHHAPDYYAFLKG